MSFDSNAYKTDFQRQNYDCIIVLIPTGKVKVVKAYAQAQGKSIFHVMEKRETYLEHYEQIINTFQMP
ncbi:MAG: hypothetical protein VB071_01905 [Lawsonibacter sp.]|nr:hypothetical protein [Lawsonibacter sp.]